MLGASQVYVLPFTSVPVRGTREDLHSMVKVSVSASLHELSAERLDRGIGPKVTRGAPCHG